MAKPVAGFNKNPQNINKNGRPPKGYSITETIKAMMDEKPEIKRELGAKVIEMAKKGDITAIKLVWAYLEGMPTEKHEVSGPEGRPITILSNKNVLQDISNSETGETK